MLTTCENKGFQITFDNGLTISVQWGTGNYCDRRNPSREYGIEMKTGAWEADSAEIAIWGQRNLPWYDFGGGTVKGYVSPDEIADWMHRVKSAKDLASV